MSQFQAMNELLKMGYRAMNRFGPSTVCPECGKDLDGGEVCDCDENRDCNFLEEDEEWHLKNLNN